MSDRQDLAAAFRKALLDKIVWNPMSEVPKDGTVSLLTDERRRVVGIFRNGEWRTERGKQLTFAPTYWMAFKDE